MIITIKQLLIIELLILNIAFFLNVNSHKYIKQSNRNIVISFVQNKVDFKF